MLLLSLKKTHDSMEYGNEKKYPSDPQHRRESEILPEAPRPFPEAAGRPSCRPNGCDITETMLGHIETGYRSTSIFEIDKLAEALKVDYNALFAQD